MASMGKARRADTAAPAQQQPLPLSLSGKEGGMVDKQKLIGRGKLCLSALCLFSLFCSARAQGRLYLIHIICILGVSLARLHQLFSGKRKTSLALRHNCCSRFSTLSTCCSLLIYIEENINVCKLWMSNSSGNDEKLSVKEGEENSACHHIQEEEWMGWRRTRKEKSNDKIICEMSGGTQWKH